MAVPSVLEKIITHKSQEVAIQKTLISEDTLIANIEASQDRPRGFMNALRESMALGGMAIIAEIKKASPSAGVIRKDFNPVEIAKSYAANGAVCLSVLTDQHFFQGNALYLHDVRAVVGLPILRKDFIIDRYQIIESRMLGADCILLIAAILNDDLLMEFTCLAHDLGMDVLVEVHDEIELARALKLPLHVVGVNNRNLHDFSISLETTIQLHKKLPEDWFLISESGIHCHDDVKYLQSVGVNAFLIGSVLMAADDPGKALNSLILGGSL